MRARSRSDGTTSPPGSPTAGHRRRPTCRTRSATSATSRSSSSSSTTTRPRSTATCTAPTRRASTTSPRWCTTSPPRASTSSTTGSSWPASSATGGVDAAYFDTRSATGGFTEIHGDPPYILDTFARWRAAHASHSPDADPVLDPSIGAIGHTGLTFRRVRRHLRWDDQGRPLPSQGSSERRSHEAMDRADDACAGRWWAWDVCRRQTGRTDRRRPRPASRRGRAGAAGRSW